MNNVEVKSMPKAIYEGIYREIRSRIINGTYAFQEMLPTEAELTAEFGCTRNTVRRALSMLADGMFVQPIHGKGVRVIWLKGETDMLGALEEVESFGEFAKRNNAVASTDVKSFEHLVCTEQLSRHLGFKVGEELIRVVRVRSLNGNARQVDHGYFLESIAKGLTPEIAADSIYGYLEHKRGVKVMASRRTVSVELANDEDCSYLGPWQVQLCRRHGEPVVHLGWHFVRGHARPHASRDLPLPRQLQAIAG